MELSRNGIVILLLGFAGKEVGGSSGYELLSFITLDDLCYIFGFCWGLERAKARKAGFEALLIRFSVRYWCSLLQQLPVDYG